MPYVGREIVRGGERSGVYVRGRNFLHLAIQIRNFVAGPTHCLTPTYLNPNPKSLVTICSVVGLCTWACPCFVLLSRRSRQRERLSVTGLSIGSVYLSVCLFVCLSRKCKNAIFSKTKQYRAMVSIDDL